MIRRTPFDGKFMVRVLCALALLLVGFAHKPPVVDRYGISPAEIAQYVLPDGTIADLCLTSEDGMSHPHGQPSWTGCEACRLTASALLPMPTDAFGKPIPREIARFVPIRGKSVYRQLFPPNALPRGPPFGLTA